MQAIAFLRQQHGEAKSAFQKIEAASPAQRGALWQTLRPALTLHEQIEERHLYGPVAREVQRDRVLSDWEATHEHQVREAESLIRTIDGLQPSEDRWLETVKQLRTALEAHIRKEEQEIWPRIEQVWSGPRLEEAGRQMQTMTSEHARTGR